MGELETLNAWLVRRGRSATAVLALCGALVVGAVDYLTGYEVSLSLLYLAPVAMAAWYGGRWTGAALAGLSCVIWYLADGAAGNRYSHPAIPVWNALVRFGFFCITSLLLTALRNAHHAQRLLARTDGLTGLYGRRAFEDRLRHDLALANRSQSPLTLAYIDLDDFKAVNDTFGHGEGDRLLRTVARVLQDSVREVDTASRIGGDEFALVLPGTDGDGARHLIAKLRDRLEEAVAAGGRRATCTLGVVTFRGGDLSPESVIAAADELMYEVKRRSKGESAFRVLGGAVQKNVEDRPA